MQDFFSQEGVSVNNVGIRAREPLMLGFGHDRVGEEEG